MDESDENAVKFIMRISDDDDDDDVDDDEEEEEEEEERKKRGRKSEKLVEISLKVR
jgi:hypothetical protein